jgi:capsular polysaccharide export protein
MSPLPEGTFGATSRKLARIPLLHGLLGNRVEHFRRAKLNCIDPREPSAMVGWGCRPTTRAARQEARRRGIPFIALEDGFLRSFGTGDRFPPLSLVRDELGIYYDSTRPSALEQLLESTADLLPEGRRAEVTRARELLLKHGLSKYNHAASLTQLEAQAGAPLLRPGDAQRVLVVDQTAGDMSVALGGGSADTFAAMLAAALDENPHATVYVKTHPEVTSGRKAGHFSAVQTGGRVVVLRQAVEPMSLLREMDRVYVVSSTLGFEALLAGKPVTCFGIPWYGGWGATDDRRHCPRRTRQRNVDDLFAAGYLHYTRYLDPVTRERGTIFNVIEWLVRQKDTASRLQGPAGPRRVICVGFRRWKAESIKAMLSLDGSQVAFVPNIEVARQVGPKPGDRLGFWGGQAPAGLMELALETSAEAVRVEDGFVRSVGLGSDLIKPLSLVLDSRGIYFDPSQPSGLEHLLSTAAFRADELAEAAAIRQFIVANGITKYNLEPRAAPAWQPNGRKVVLVPGQVEDDASIRLGCTDVRTNLGLLQAARAACPEAYIVYKPHPDVTSGNRQGRMALGEAMQWADHVETDVSIVSCLDACDEVHTMTSLTGFDALLRGKKVVVYGQPFYAGWGLTHDVLGNTGAIALARRQRRLTLDELVAGTLLRYPIYWDWELKGYTTCMAVLRQLVASRDALATSGGLNKLRSGWWRRQWRKARILAKAWAGT